MLSVSEIAEPRQGSVLKAQRTVKELTVSLKQSGGARTLFESAKEPRLGKEVCSKHKGQ